MQEQQDETTLPKLDEATTQLLEKRILEKLSDYAPDCHDAIWVDAVRAAHEARAHGASPESAARQTIDPYHLRAGDIEWLRSFVPEESATLAALKRLTTLAVVLTVSILLLLFSSVNSLSGIAVILILFSPALIWYATLPILKKNALARFGPTGCAFLAPGMGWSLFFFFGGVLGLLALSLNIGVGGMGIVISIVSLLVVIGLILAVSDYFEVRKRIKKNYKHVTRILEMPQG